MGLLDQHPHTTNTITQPKRFYANNSFLTDISHFQYIKSMKTFQRLECYFHFTFKGVGWGMECVSNAFPSTGKSKSKNIQWGPALHANQPKPEVLFGVALIYTWKCFENEGLNLGAVSLRGSFVHRFHCGEDLWEGRLGFMVQIQCETRNYHKYFKFNKNKTGKNAQEHGNV